MKIENGENGKSVRDKLNANIQQVQSNSEQIGVLRDRIASSVEKVREHERRISRLDNIAEANNSAIRGHEREIYRIKGDLKKMSITLYQYNISIRKNKQGLEKLHERVTRIEKIIGGKTNNTLLS